MGEILVYDINGKRLDYQHFPVSDLRSARAYVEAIGGLPQGSFRLDWTDGNKIVPINYKKENLYLLNEVNDDFFT